MEEITC